MGTVRSGVANCLFVGSAGGSGRDQLVAALQAMHCRVETCDDVDAARDRVIEQQFDLIVFDLRDDGVDVASLVADWSPNASLVLTGGAEHRQKAVDALGNGIANFLCEPFDVEHAAAALKSEATLHFYKSEYVRLATLQSDSSPVEFFVGKSPAMRRLDSAIRRACELDATVLIEGAAGTGKTLVANTLHFCGHRASRPLVTAYGADLTEESIVDALDDASSGTFVIEHVETMSTRVQSRLVRILKERGSGSSDDARIVVTTQGRLAELTANGSFREDLYYRINVYPIQMPHLRERTEDIAELAESFLLRASAVSGTSHKGFTPAAMVLLETNPWPGNVAQLRNAVFRAHALAGRKPVDRMHLLGPVMGVQAPPEVAEMRAPRDEPEIVRESDILSFQEEEKRILSRALKAAKGNVRKAAELLGIGRATLYRKIQIFELSLS